MKQELQNKIFQKYPTIFQDRTKSKQETCMCWGLSCGDGWYHIIDKLCYNLTKIEKEYDVKIIADQVKEKFGSLRFYYHFELGSKWTIKSNVFQLFLCYISEYNLPRFIYRFINKINSFINYRKYYFNGKNKIPLHRVFKENDHEWMFAYDGVNNLISEHVSFATSMSLFVCEECGMTGVKIRSNSWVHATCDKCEQKEK
jgi:hypothetical protein